MVLQITTGTLWFNNQMCTHAHTPPSPITLLNPQNCASHLNFFGKLWEIADAEAVEGWHAFDLEPVLIGQVEKADEAEVHRQVTEAAGRAIFG